MIDTNHTVGQIATQLPVSTRVFGRHKINFCCGGAIPLGDACAQRELNVEQIVEEIEDEIALASPTALDGWADQPTHTLIAHILQRYHRPLDEELPRLEFLANKVARVHHDRNERLPQLAFTMSALKSELEAHMIKEERVLFPSILSGDTSRLACPIAVMLRDHDDAFDLLEIMRGLTDDYTMPAHACGSWQALWHGLEDLERSLQEHIHLENNILFPRVQ